jgi:hypothetical protein
MKSSFPLFLEIKNFLLILKVEIINGKTIIPVLKFAFGTETSVNTKIPHYQIYLEFDKLVRNSSVYQALNELLANRVHIVTKKVYSSQYNDYCLKHTSNFNFNSKYYWNLKLSSENLKEAISSLVSLRPNLKMIQTNLMTGQELF